MTLPAFERDNEWIDALKALAEAHQGNHQSEALFVPAYDSNDSLINDVESEDELEPDIEELQLNLDWSNFNASEAVTELEPHEANLTIPSNAVIAVDAGIIDLGELVSGGVAFAVRGSAVCYPPNNALPFVCHYNTGALVVDQQNQLELFHYMGHRLGQSNLFVNIQPTGVYTAKSAGMSDTPNKIRDRFRLYR